MSFASLPVEVKSEAWGPKLILSRKTVRFK